MTNHMLPVQDTTSYSYEPGIVLQFPALQGLSAEAAENFQEGLARLQMAEPEEAVELLSRAVELAPRFPEARICLGLAFALTHNIYPAIDHLEMAGKLDPESFAAHFTLAQLNFKLRIPQKGYEAAERALKCVTTIEQRRKLTELLREERARARGGIVRPWFNKPFSRFSVLLAGSGLAAAITALLLHLRW
jgi:tetratricopeptide (TPR) repeat protein